MNSTAAKSSADDPAISSLALLEGMIASLREGVIVIDKDWRIFASNPAARSLFRGKAVNSQDLRDVVSDPVVRDAFRGALDAGTRTETKVEIRIGIDNRVYDLRVAPLNIAGKDAQRHAIGIFYDITRLERLEKVRQEFLSNVSHELRTPLTSILAFVETLENGALEDKDNNHRFLDVIRRNAERMHHLIDDILELSAIEAGKITVDPRSVDLGRLVDDVWSTLAEKAATRRITFVNEIDPGTSVFADPRRLEQILINLFGNAVKFNREGGSVSASYRCVNGTHRISVADTGEGISAEHLPRIFERFYRTDTARSRELGGTGLGLAIVKHLARLHHGEARVESTVGQGSVFTVELAGR